MTTPDTLWRPGSLRPMLATPVAGPFDDPQWLFEIKWDGYRCLAFVDEGLFLQSRTGRDLLPRFPQLAVLAGAWGRDRAILDGEVVAFQGGLPSFAALGRGTAGGDEPAAVKYVVFDLLHWAGEDLIHLPLHRRRDRLAQLLAGLPPEAAHLVGLSEATAGEGRRLYRGAARLGLEGIVAKERDSLYHPGRRSRRWRKVRRVRTGDFIIGGVQPGERGGFGSLLLGAWDGRGGLRYVGSVGTGFSAGELGRLLAGLTPRRDSPFRDDVPWRPGTIFVEPRLACRVEYLAVTPGGRLRHPVYRGLVDPR
ncbi:MAG TPA: non-homologous end-joining DNA ligase [Sphingobacteriaceae bacterium]|nr:non-homologous end-joining DNA ligase [Sphingobacteriaceae bacterium]